MTNVRQTIESIVRDDKISDREKLNYIAYQVSTLPEANKPSSFSVKRRDEGHWDVYNAAGNREWRVRGDPGQVEVFDERDVLTLRVTKKFTSLQSAMLFIIDYYMSEA